MCSGRLREAKAASPSAAGSSRCSANTVPSSSLPQSGQRRSARAPSGSVIAVAVIDRQNRGVRALVTGAGGFVGANLAASLAAAGHEVVAWVRPGPPAWRLDHLAEEIEVVPVELLDEDAVPA